MPQVPLPKCIVVPTPKAGALKPKQIQAASVFPDPSNVASEAVAQGRSHGVFSTGSQAMTDGGRVSSIPRPSVEVKNWYLPRFFNFSTFHLPSPHLLLNHGAARGAGYLYGTINHFVFLGPGNYTTQQKKSRFHLDQPTSSNSSKYSVLHDQQNLAPTTTPRATPNLTGLLSACRVSLEIIGIAKYH